MSKETLLPHKEEGGNVLHFPLWFNLNHSSSLLVMSFLCIHFRCVSFLPPNMSFPSLPYGKIAYVSLPPRKALQHTGTVLRRSHNPSYSIQELAVVSAPRDLLEDSKSSSNVPRPPAWRQEDECMYWVTRVCVVCSVLQLLSDLCDPKDYCSPPGSSV